MVQFGATLKAQRKKDWQEYYIDYHGLKGQLKALKAAYEEAGQARPDTPQQQQGPHGWESSPLALANKGHGFGGGGGGGGGGGEMISERSPSLQSIGGGECETPASGANRMSFRNRLANRYSMPVGQEIGVLEERFSETLDSEVEKVVLFFLAKQGELAKLLLDAKQGVGEASYHATAAGGGGGGESTALMRAEDEEEGRGGGAEGGGYQASSLTVAAWGGGKDHYSIYCAMGREIAELMRFLQLNVSGLRKILKKHDKQIRDKLIATNYLSTRTLEKYSSMRQLYNNAGVMALVGSLRKAFEHAEMDRFRSVSMSRAPEFSPAAATAAASKDSVGSEDEAGCSLFRRKLSLRSMRAAARSLSEIYFTDGVFGEIASAQRALAEAQQLTTSKYLSRQVLLEGWELAAVDEGTERAMTRELHRPSAYINLATTFLYMTNYYIVGPTSAEYAAALGGSPAVSGLIIGMTPIAACFSCLLYSWWTNTSFRGPLLLCSVINVVGNLLYGLALSYDAFWMVLVGRTLIGFGGARGVNRRYIADTIPIASRTAYSAAFVAVGALGMAFGPFFSAVMNGVEFEIAGVTFNGLTNPGWIMFIFWIVMGLIIHFEFQEPPHYLSSSSDVGSDEESAKNTPTHDRLSSKRAAVADYEYSAVRITAPTEVSIAEMNSSGGGGGGGSYGSTPTTTAAAASATPAISNSGGGATTTARNGGKSIAQENETAQLLPGGATVAAAAAAVAAGAADGQGKEGDEDEDESTGDGGGRYGALSAITPPLGFCLYGYFVNKLITEAAVSSAPVLAQYMFDWSVREVGLLMAVLGLVVLPVNATIGRLSMVYEDRVLLQLLAVLAGLGCIIIVDFSWSPFEYTQTQYIVGVSLIFVALQAHEGVVMSVTSKIIPVELARGTWNSGFLATEAGTFGRFVGDAFITVLGVMTMSWLDFLLFVPSVFLVVSMILGFSVVYPFLQGQ